MEQEVRNAKQHGKYETLERLAKKKRKKWKDNNNNKKWDFNRKKTFAKTNRTGGYEFTGIQKKNEWKRLKEEGKESRQEKPEMFEI